MTLERDDSGRRGVLASLNRLVVASFARFAISNVQIQNKQQETLKWFSLKKKQKKKNKQTNQQKKTSKPNIIDWDQSSSGRPIRAPGLIFIEFIMWVLVWSWSNQLIDHAD